MATVTAPNRSFVGWLFIVGGALQVVGAIVGFANVGNAGAIYAISNIAIGSAFVLLLAWFAPTTIARVAYFIAALGWLLLALTSLVNLGAIGSVATYIAIVGCVFAGVIVLTGHPFGALADILFFVAMVLGAIELLMSQNSNVPGFLKGFVVVLFGGFLVASAALILRRR